MIDRKEAWVASMSVDAHIRNWPDRLRLTWAILRGKPFTLKLNAPTVDGVPFRLLPAGPDGGDA